MVPYHVCMLFRQEDKFALVTAQGVFESEAEALGASLLEAGNSGNLLGYVVVDVRDVILDTFKELIEKNSFEVIDGALRKEVVNVQDIKKLFDGLWTEEAKF